MSKVPFEKFIVSLLLSGKSIPYIVDKLKTFHYFIQDEEVSGIFDDVKAILPESLRNHIVNGHQFDVRDESHVQWLKQLNIFEMYHYMHRAPTEEPAPYFKWIEDILWAHTHEDVMTLINIFMYNGEDKESISKIVKFKFRRKIGFDALILYEMTFWDSTTITSKEAMYHCLPFRSNVAIVRKLRNGGNEVATVDQDLNNGSDVDFLFHDNNYIKWKIGYKDVEIPDAKSFFDDVKKDSYFKYYESMNMTQSIDVFDEDGENDKLGAFNAHKVSRKNVEEQRVKLVKHWLDIFLKANESAPEGAQKKKFFEELSQVSLEFNDDDKIVSVDQVDGMLEDIKGDM